MLVGEGVVPPIVYVALVAGVPVNVKFIVDAGVFAFDVNTAVVSVIVTLLLDDAAIGTLILEDFEKVPNDPAYVENVGAVDTVKDAAPDLTAPPSLFSILIK